MKEFIGQNCKFHFRDAAKAPLADGRATIALTFVLKAIKGGFLVGEEFLIPVNAISYVEKA